MTTAYMIALIIGGGFMAISLFSDVLEGTDLEVDVDFDGEVDASLGGTAGAGALKILSLRTVVYALFGFGAVGSMLTRLWGPDQSTQTIVWAAAGGLATGVVASALFGLLKRSDTGDRLHEGTFIGLTGNVTLPMDDASPGRVTVFRGDRTITLRALPHASAESEPEEWSEVLVVEMENGVARVVPVDSSLSLPAEDS